MRELRFAIVGTGFWSRFQLAGCEVGNVRCVAVYNRTRQKAEKFATEFEIPAVYDDPGEMLPARTWTSLMSSPDVDTHSLFVHLAAGHRLPVVCQKPLAPSLAVARAMVDACRAAGVPLLVNENFRWQTPIGALDRELRSGAIGKVFRANPVRQQLPGFRQLTFSETTRPVHPGRRRLRISSMSHGSCSGRRNRGTAVRPAFIRTFGAKTSPRSCSA